MNTTSKLCFFSLFSIFILACGPDASAPSNDGSESANRSHDHGHDHGSEGPHGGHILGLGDEEFHLEWLHNESGKLTFYLLDAAAKADVSTAAKSIAITTTIIDETATVTLNTTTPDGDEHNKFEAIDPVLLERLKLVGHGVAASASVQIDGKQYTGEFEHHDHGHGHSH